MYLTTRVDPVNLYPSLNPLTWPEVGLLPAVAILLGVLPAWLAPPPEPTQEPADPHADIPRQDTAPADGPRAQAARK